MLRCVEGHNLIRCAQDGTFHFRDVLSEHALHIWRTIDLAQKGVLVKHEKRHEVIHHRVSGPGPADAPTRGVGLVSKYCFYVWAERAFVWIVGVGFHHVADGHHLVGGTVDSDHLDLHPSFVIQVMVDATHRQGQIFQKMPPLWMRPLRTSQSFQYGARCL